MTYAPPVADMMFVLQNICSLEELSQRAGYEHAHPDSVSEILDQASRMIRKSVAPLNRVGDKQGSNLVDDKVTTPAGWKAAYEDYAEGGWIAASCDTAIGGMGLPHVVGAALQEMLQGANMAFALCPMLSQAAIKTLSLIGTKEQQDQFLPRLLSGEWTGTMVLTEPQAGSDLAAVRTRAELDGDDYRITGQKIFITYGDHDLTENIVHLVLARTSAAAGTKGLSLMVVPKFVVNRNGSLGPTNNVKCVSLEHKLGIHGSPTAVLTFGEHGTCRGQLLGEEGRGLEYMFIMMNEARLSVGIQGLGIAERAYQTAKAYASERVQGRSVDTTAQGSPISHHPDVHRMLMTMRAKCEAMRGLAYVAAKCLDSVDTSASDKERSYHMARLGLLVPVVKGWCTEQACEIASLCIQVHGGMGYVEETGAAQIFRDARITSIYEGTTGIQANDLLGRKILRDNGVAAKRLIGEMRIIEGDLADRSEREFQVIGAALTEGNNALETAIDTLAEVHNRRPQEAYASAMNFLHLFGLTTGCWVLARGALAASNHEPAILESKLGVAHFYAGQIMPEVNSRLLAIADPSASALALFPNHEPAFA